MAWCLEITHHHASSRININSINIININIIIMHDVETSTYCRSNSKKRKFRQKRPSAVSLLARGANRLGCTLI